MLKTGWFAKACVSILTALITLELVSRLVAVSPSKLAYLMQNWQVASFVSVVDTTGASLYKPNVAFGALNPDAELIPMRSDSFGFRNGRDYGTQPILAIGDSMTYGDGVPLADRWADLLANHMETGVYCFAAARSGPPQQIDLLSRTLRELHPGTNLVLWMITSINDVEDSYKYNVTNTQPRQPQGNPSHGLSLAAGVLNYSYAARLGFVVSRVGRYWFSRGHVGGMRVKVYGNYVEFHPVANGYLSSSEFESGWMKLADAVVAFSRKVKNEGRRIVLIYAPSKEETYRDLLAAAGVEASRIESFNGRLAMLAAHEGIEMVDLTNPFYDEAKKGVLLYFRTDAHWNRRGNRLAAQVISKYLRSSGS